MTIREFFESRGYSLPPEDFYRLIGSWDGWYRGDVPSFHRYQVYNGEKHVDMRRATLGMAKKVCEDWAGMLLNERAEINFSDENTGDFVKKTLETSNWRVRGSEAQEIKAALGTVAYVPYIEGADYDEETGTASGGRIRIDVIPADCIFPLSWRGGEIDECAFVSSCCDGGEKYIYAQIFTLDENGNYVQENALFTEESGGIKPAKLSDTKAFAGLLKKISYGTPEKPFIIDRMNIANNLYRGCPLGISVFANAIDTLKGIDLVYDSYSNEFILGKKRIMAKYQALRFGDGKPVFDSSDVVFYNLPDDTSPEPFIKEIDMTLRAEEHNLALQNGLMLLSAKCGLGGVYYRLDRSSAVTATQVISENSELYKTLKKHELILESALVSLSRRIISLANYILGENLDENCEISILFDDSIIEDKAQRRLQSQMEFGAGLIDRVQYFVDVYGMTGGRAEAFVREMDARSGSDPRLDELKNLISGGFQC